MQFHVFIIGEAGFEKTHLISTTFQSFSKVLLYKPEDPEKPRIPLIAPKSVSVVDINGTTIRPGLGIGTDNFFSH